MTHLSWVRVWWHCLRTGHRPAELFDENRKPIDLCADCGFPTPETRWVFDGHRWREGTPEEVQAWSDLASLVQGARPDSPPFLFVLPHLRHEDDV